MKGCDNTTCPTIFFIVAPCGDKPCVHTKYIALYAVMYMAS
jgi:hypothetical protein